MLLDFLLQMVVGLVEASRAAFDLTLHFLAVLNLTVQCQNDGRRQKEARCENTPWDPVDLGADRLHRFIVYDPLPPADCKRAGMVIFAPPRLRRIDGRGIFAFSGSVKVGQL